MNKYKNGAAGLASFAVAIFALCIVGLIYALFIELFWNNVVADVVTSVCKITYWKSYLAFLFFVVLPKIMPIRFNLKNTNKDEGK